MCQNCYNKRDYKLNPIKFKNRAKIHYYKKDKIHRIKIQKKSYYENHEQKLKQAAKYRKNNPLKLKDTYYKYVFGISLNEYEDMQKSQYNTCAVCKQLETAKYRGKIKRLAVHHDHSDGRVIALLCQRCNTILGIAEENIKLFKVMICCLEIYNITGKYHLSTEELNKNSKLNMKRLHDLLSYHNRQYPLPAHLVQLSNNVTKLRQKITV